MTLARLTYPLLLVAASFAVIAEAVVAWGDHVPVWLAVPCAIATGGGVLFAGLALDTLARAAVRPDRRDIAAVRDVQRSNAALLDSHAARLCRAEARLMYLCIQPELSDRLRDIARAAERIETWQAVAADLPAWTTAVDEWGATLEMMQPGLAPDGTSPDASQLQSARALLPPAQNFSSSDLKAALVYLVRREHVAAAYDRLQVYGRSLAC